MSKRLITRDKDDVGDVGEVAIWPAKAKCELEGPIWMDEVSKSAILKSQDFKDIFGFTPRKGSKALYEISCRFLERRSR